MPAVYRDIVVVLIAYLIGGIPFSHIVSRWGANVDICERGEGNVGARNVYHVAGRGWGILAAVLDLSKGVAAYYFGSRLTASMVGFLACGIAVGLGHNFSPFLRFRGGKGLSVTFAFLASWLPWSTVVGCIAIITGYLLTRDINKALVAGIPLIVLLPPLFGAAWWVVPYVSALFLLLALKKVIDRPHEQAVWARDPWAEGQPGFTPDAPLDANGTGGEEVSKP
jgi:glycerol-3-phosphate acyltransferase PlsY